MTVVIIKNIPQSPFNQSTNSPEEAPNEAQYIHIGIEKGEITSVDGEKLSPYQCLVALNKPAALHGVGRIDIVENRLVGMKSRGCYETPGGTVMVTALRALEELVLDKECRKWKNTFANEFAHLVYDGRWFTPLKDSILASAEALAEVFTGEIVVKLYKGNVTAVQKKSPNSLYSEDFATFGADDVYNQSHAEGFIRLFSLSSRITALSKENTK